MHHVLSLSLPSTLIYPFLTWYHFPVPRGLVSVSIRGCKSLLAMAYFNETGPIYQQELVQANEFSKFVHAHVVTANKSPDGNPDLENDAVRFDWEAFRVALSSSQASDLSLEHEVCVLVPAYSVDTPQSTPTTETSGTDADVTTVQSVLDTLVARFASLFAHVLFIPASDATLAPDTGYGAPEPEPGRAYFFDVLRRNLYCAFTRHLGATDAHEHYLSMHRCSQLDADVGACSAWEYRLLFVHSDARSRTVKGLVMTGTLEGNFEDEIRRVQSSEDGDGDDGEEDGDGDWDWDECEGEDTDSDEEEDEDEVWYGVLLDSKAPFSGTLRAMQVTIGEGFRCP